MDFVALQLAAGSVVQLQVTAGDGGQQTVKGFYIGCHVPRSVLVAVPARAVGPLLRPGVKVVASVITATGLGHFTSQVDVVAVQPFAYVHLQYPTTVSLRNVRAAARVAVELPLMSTNLDDFDLMEAQPGMLLDVSVRGARVGAHCELGKVGDELSLHLRCAFDDIARELTLTGKIRARPVAESVGGPYPHVYGVEFAALEEDKRVLLHAYVAHLLAQNGPLI